MTHLLFALGFAAAALQAQPAPYLADVKTWTTTSAAKRSYQISVALPDGYSKDHAAYPVLFAVDANTEFGTLVETARLLKVGSEIPDLVIVGIGYANPGQGFKASGGPRTLDLTPTADPGWKGEAGAQAATESGGAREFLAFLKTELVPAIERDYNVRRDDRGLFGHSFGGLFGTYALLNNDGLFRRFIIGSPSVWWDKQSILSMEAQFAQSKKPLPARVFLSVGQNEPGVMTSGLRDLVKRFEQHRYQGLEYKVQYFEGESHLSVVGATANRGLRYIYSERAGLIK